MSQRDPARFDLQAALSRSLQPVDLREFQKKNVNRVRLLKTEELKGSVRDAIDRALTGHMEELRKLREREKSLSAEVAALHAKITEESGRRQIAESALAAAQAMPAQVVVQGPAPEEIARIREEAKSALEELADLRIALEGAQEDAAEGRAELLRVQEQFDHMRSELERAQTELEEARGRLGEALVERERMRIELDSEMTRELPAQAAAAPDPLPGDRTAVAALASLGLVASSETPREVEPRPEAGFETVIEMPGSPQSAPEAPSAPASQSSETEVLPAAPSKPKAPKVAFFGFGPALSTGGGRPATWRRREGTNEDEGRK